MAWETQNQKPNEGNEGNENNKNNLDNVKKAPKVWDNARKIESALVTDQTSQELNKQKEIINEEKNNEKSKSEVNMKALKEVRDANIELAKNALGIVDNIIERNPKYADKIKKYFGEMQNIKSTISSLEKENKPEKIVALINKLKSYASQALAKIMSEGGLLKYALYNDIIKEDEKEALLENIKELTNINEKEAKALNMSQEEAQKINIRTIRESERAEVYKEEDEKLKKKHDIDSFSEMVINAFKGIPIIWELFMGIMYGDYFEELNSEDFKKKVERKLDEKLYNDYWIVTDNEKKKRDEKEREKTTKEKQWWAIEKKFGSSTKNYYIEASEEIEKAKRQKAEKRAEEDTKKEGKWEEEVKVSTFMESSIERDKDWRIENIIIRWVEYSLTNQSSYWLKMNTYTGEYDIVNKDLKDKKLLSFKELFQKAIQEPEKEEFTILEDQPYRFLTLGHIDYFKEDIVLKKWAAITKKEALDREKELAANLWINGKRAKEMENSKATYINPYGNNNTPKEAEKKD